MRAGRCIAGALLMAALLLAPASSSATDSDLRHAYAFRVEASNGYSILASAASERADGRGAIELIVSRGHESAAYAAPALLTASSLSADLGPLGKVDLTVSPSGRKKRIRSTCGVEPESFTYEPPRYAGSFEFHGEEGYTDAVTASPVEYTRFFAELLCPGVDSEEGEGTGSGFPGARLRLRVRHGDFRLRFQANENRLGKRSHFEVEVHERRGGIVISRGTALWLGPGELRFDPSLRTATLGSEGPFSGRASFRRAAPLARRWTGDLTIDLPGRSNVPLTGPAVRATLVHACRREDGGHSC